MHCIAGSTVIYLMQAIVYDMHIYCYIMLTAIEKIHVSITVVIKSVTLSIQII